MNARAGYGLGAGALAELKEFFARTAGAFDWSVAGSRDEAIRATRESLRQGVDQVVAVGGDGTVNAVANGFFDHGQPIRPQSSLAIGNTGTGSDYFKTVAAGPSLAGLTFPPSVMVTI